MVDDGSTVVTFGATELDINGKHAKVPFETISKRQPDGSYLVVYNKITTTNNDL